MGNAQSNFYNTQQNFMNDILQSNQQNCVSTTVDTTDNNIVIVNGSTINGNFAGVTTTTNTDVTCLITSNMGNSISNILSSIASQANKAETDWFNDFTFDIGVNAFNVNQSVTNNISQLNQATCGANNTTSTSNNYVYVANSTVNGNFVGVSSSANASANCTMQNVMKNTTYNQAQAQATQSNTVIGTFGILAAIIAVVIVVLIIFGFLMVGGKAFSGQSGPQSAITSTMSPEDIELQNLVASLNK